MNRPSDAAAPGLDAYRAKRDFEKTPEPGPRDGASDDLDAPRFVVQEHHARRLHWDLRLEHDGTLASWAVPKGIPMDPATNHLAVRTEDHPLEYLEFHGEIPKGQYGAGTMTIWDRGTFEVEKWRDREVMGVFHGERMRGRYVLFRTGGDLWMIHRMDPPADPQAEPLPKRIEPMLAKLQTTLPPDEDRWAFEIKWDGVRAIAFVEGGRIRLQARSGNDITPRYPEVGGLGPALGARPVVLDGEVVAFDENGRPDFGRLQTRMHIASDAAVRRRMKEVPATYVIFDVLHLDGTSTMGLPYEERRELLDGLGLNGPSWRTPAYRVGEGKALLDASRELELEGVVAKRLGSVYEPGRRSPTWLKIKNVYRQELVVGGWLPGEGGRSGRVGALLVGYHDEEGRLRYAGRVGSGFTEAELKRVKQKLDELATDGNPFEAGPKVPKGAHFTEPRLVAEVEFREWTRTGTLRAPTYQGLREDVDPKRVEREDLESAPAPSAPELPSSVSAAAKRKRGSTRAEVEIDGRTLSLSNLDKVLYPKAGFTKGQVIDYYAAIGPTLVEHLRDRPLTLKRYPNGVEAAYFYEKQAPSHRPDWVRTAKAGDIEYVVVEEVATLVWLANLADLEMHPSLSKVQDMSRPTVIAFDLDPGPPAAIVECCRVALWVHELFDALGMESFVKTSGSKGMQVYVPLNSTATYSETKPFSQGVAQLLEKQHPELVVSRQTKALRKGKVLVDWSQNTESKTTISVWSLRARDRPTVSTPVTWDEVAQAVEEERPELLTFEAPAALERAAAGDLWADVLTLRQELPDLGGRVG
jgi:bifunctional non-homologous end joining protein LigD